ncbi:MAG: efflux RND transporter permease subunit [Lachnospiraceae bacterium]|nr:efflux RND transporter permease subunit [Lachnospiraceae bacterium]
MVKFGEKIVKHRMAIFVIALLLLIPSAFGYFNTRVNYDILSYLPGDIETMKGQDILTEEFGTGGFSMFVVEGMENKDIVKLKADIEDVDHVSKVIWYDSLADISIPMSVLPDELKNSFNTEDSTLMAIIFDDTTSSDHTMEAIKEIKSIAGKQCFLSGMSAIVTDTKDLSEKETPIYVCIAVILSVCVLSVTMDSFLIPVFFLLSIGIAIVYNLGSNIIFGEISYITKALTAVLQLGVTMDYSIFLWHSYKEQQQVFKGDKEKAMANAIASTITSVVGSSITTVAGFIALCFMSFTLGLDLGLVMAKGVVFGVICCVTVLPSMILLFDKAIEKTSHKNILPKFDKFSDFVCKYHLIFVIIFAVALLPAYYCNSKTPVYYNLDETLPKDLDSVVANAKLKEKYDMNSTHMILVDADLSSVQVAKMCDEIDDLDGIKAVLGIDAITGGTIPSDILPASLTETLKNENWQMIMVMSEYKTASDEVNKQCDQISKIIKNYDKSSMLVGEAPCTKDLIEITDKDFKTVSAVSIGIIFIIIAVIFKSVSLPLILVSVIEFAIFINMGIPFLTGTKVPFIASIVIGTIQLGSTVDYAILMTTRYRKERHEGRDKREAVTTAHKSSVQSIIVSALSFFAATFGVGMYSEIDMISSLCTLMARGAIISMIVVLLVLPSMLILFDKVICHTSAGFLRKE